MPETVAAVHGACRDGYLQCLRRKVGDGWIRWLMDQAEKECLHPIALVTIAQPMRPKRRPILGAQWLL